jgi:hypothetical protein
VDVNTSVGGKRRREEKPERQEGDKLRPLRTCRSQFRVTVTPGDNLGAGNYGAAPAKRHFRQATPGPQTTASPGYHHRAEGRLPLVCGDVRRKTNAKPYLSVPFSLIVANSPEPKKSKKVMTGVGLEPTLSFPNQEIDIKVNLNLAP